MSEDIAMEAMLKAAEQIENTGKTPGDIRVYGCFPGSLRVSI